MKNVFKGLRVTEKTDIALEGVVEACKKYNLNMNGSGEVTTSQLLSFFYEDITKSPEAERIPKIEKLLSMYPFTHKNILNQRPDPTLIKLIAREVNNAIIRH